MLGALHGRRITAAATVLVLLGVLSAAGWARAGWARAGWASAGWASAAATRARPATGPRPNQNPGLAALLSVTALSSRSAWAVGTLIEHWNGRTWTVQPSPNPTVSPAGLSGVAAVSASDAWAAGYATQQPGSTETLIEHWNGRTWQVQPSFSAGAAFNQLFGVTAVSGTDAWVTGHYTSSTTQSSLVEHWNGQMWSVQSTENPSAVVIQRDRPFAILRAGHTTVHPAVDRMRPLWLA